MIEAVLIDVKGVCMHLRHNTFGRITGAKPVKASGQFMRVPGKIFARHADGELDDLVVAQIRTGAAAQPGRKLLVIF